MSQIENQKPVVLAIGGLDPSGGAGITLDAAAIRAAGAHPATVAAVITEQSGRRFVDARAEPGTRTERAARLILEDLDVGAIKIGALRSSDNISAIERLSKELDAPPMVLDPVIRSSSGGLLMSDDAIGILKRHLIHRLRLITPNLVEAELLTGRPIRHRDDMLPAVNTLRAMGARAVLLKGGHLPGDAAIDLLVDDDGEARFFESKRIVRHDVRGTGCALAALIAGHLALRRPLAEAVSRARAALQSAIQHSTAIGNGIHVLNFDTD